MNASLLSSFSWSVIFVSLDVDDGIKREYVPVPIPVPVFIPMPMNMYSQVTPTPVSLPIPVRRSSWTQETNKPAWLLTQRLRPGACACVSAYDPAGGRADYWEHQWAEKQRDPWAAACASNTQRGPERRYSRVTWVSSSVLVSLVFHLW